MDCLFKQKKLKYEGVTVEESWNTEDFQTRPDTLSGAGVDIDTPFWNKQYNENYFLDWNQLPIIDQKKIKKYIIDQDNNQFELEKEKAGMME